MTEKLQPPETQSSKSVGDGAADVWHSMIHWNEVPRWMQDNHYIHTNYRRASYSYKRSFRSILHWHNESVNIWSHLVPGILAIPSGFLLYHILLSRYGRATASDVAAMSCFFLGAALCLGMSATYHTISNHSPTVNRFGNQLDYVGIVLLITGSFVPSIFYGFWCDQQRRLLYWTMIITLGAGCATVSVTPKFRTPQWRPFRASMFVAMGGSAVLPVLDGLITYGWKNMESQIGLSWLVLQGLLYISGAALYAARIPERWYPGRFDTLGTSHQIFHVLVVLAALSHLTGLLKAFDYRHGINARSC